MAGTGAEKHAPIGDDFEKYQLHCDPTPQLELADRVCARCVRDAFVRGSRHWQLRDDSTMVLFGLSPSTSILVLPSALLPWPANLSRKPVFNGLNLF
jgi:hypothetical protein